KAENTNVEVANLELVSIEQNTGDHAPVQELENTDEANRHFTSSPHLISDSGVSPEYEQSNGGLGIWNVGGEVVLIGQCWSNKNEPFSNKNNINEMNKYLESTYGKEYVVYSFIPVSGGKRLNRCQVYEMDCFSISKVLEIVKTAKCWTDLHDNGKIIVEACNDKGPLIMLVLCAILAYTKTMPSAEVAFKNLSRNSNFPLPASEVVLRYTKYFDQLFNIRPDWKPQKLLLNQVILTVFTNRLLKEDQKPEWVIKDGGGIREITENYYRDGNFIVFSMMNMVLQGDVELCLCSSDGKSRQTLFSLSINTFFYKAGLYRFRFSEIELSTAILSRLEDFSDDNLLIDVIFTDSREVERSSLYILEQNHIHDLKTLKDHIPGEVPKEKYKLFASNNFNEIIGCFCTLMDYTLEEGFELVTRLESFGYKNLIYQANPIQVPLMENGVKSMSENDDKACAPTIFTEEENQLPLVLSRDGCFSIVPLEIITDVAIQKAVNTPVGLKTRFRKRTSVDKLEPPALVAVHPLHWSPLTDIEETIFYDIKELEADIDHTRFEELFCEALALREKSKIKEASLAGSNVVNDQRRLFLVSLSIRHLEMRGITSASLAEMIHNRPETLALQELLNIERIIPLESELAMMKSADTAFLCDVERTMLSYCQINDLGKKVKLLIFERKFCEEMALNKQNISDVFSVLNKILDSKELRMVLKVILNIGNAINYRYSVRRRLASGYRLETINMLSSYSGKRGTTLFDFMKDSLEKYGIDLGCMVKDLRLVHSVKDIELTSIREKVNKQIICYNEQLVEYELLDNEDRCRYKHIIGCACKILMEISQLYKECSIYSSVVKRKFGENDLKPIKEIFETISGFLKRIENNSQQD
ncbi:hypothetical protein PAEPH01_2330, partial [Pancytospora epiphaga]